VSASEVVADETLRLVGATRVALSPYVHIDVYATEN